MSELLGVDELPDRAVVDLEAALGELSHEPAQGEVPLPAAPDQPVAMRAGDLLRLVAADLARRDAAGGRDPLHPVDRRAVADAETGRRLPTREPFLRHRRHNTLAKIHRISSTHPGWPPRPVQTVNQNPADSRIPNRFNANSSRSRYQRSLSPSTPDALNQTAERTMTPAVRDTPGVDFHLGSLL